MKLFITGTDTNVGKTYISKLILQSANQAGLSTLGLKPVASGTTSLTSRENEDALTLQMASSIELPYEKINPFIFTSPTAPHIAASHENCPLSVKAISNTMRDALNTKVDLCLIEGAGGWLTPLNETETMADFVTAHNFPVLLIVGIRLGCINHSLLTQRALLEDSVNVIGWVANCLDPDMLFPEKTIESIGARLNFPHVATVKRDEIKLTGNLISKMIALHEIDH